MSALTNNELDAPPWLRVESTLMSTARLIREAFDARLHTLDLNLTQASLLAFVVEFGATTQTQLADRLGIGRAAIGTVIDQLQRRDLVARHPNPDDRRVWLIDVTDAGRAMAARIAAVDEQLRGELRHGIGREERQALSWVLTRLQQNLQSAIADTDLPSASADINLPSASADTDLPSASADTDLPSASADTNSHHESN